jgi:putative membrane protein insertion efficiency factor
MRKLIVAVLRLYKVMLSPLLPSACRYYPSCSEYMRQAVEKYGVARGLWMGAKRLLRCHPFHAGGLDPVPEPTSSK